MILIVEDEVKLAELLAEYFQQANFACHCIHHGDEVIPWLNENTADLILLDLMLPGKDGLTLCKEITASVGIPIIITTAKVEEIDRLLGLELGADDYVCKPYSPREVVARAKAVMRRTTTVIRRDTHQVDVVQTVDERLSLSFEGKLLEFTAVEYQLVKQLVGSPGKIFSRDQLMQNMYNDNRIVSDRTIDSHIKKIRKKLCDSFGESEWIQSVYGVGYRFDLASSVS